ncbi:glutamate--tRNA ligase [Pseudomonadota bacterium AL_CKDN230030165-1A_HGKHYDSX7]
MTSQATKPVRTRFAPSPTGFLHLGGARTALFSWAFARHHKGVFVLRIEDTDVERSTDAAVQAILDSMDWLGMQPDEGPFYQMKRMDRYREVLAGMLEAGTVYHCYSSPEEVEAMREAARARGDKPRYDGTWRPEPGKTLPPVPADRKPVIRFKNPQTGATSWDDMVKGTISFDNTELDDLIIARPDGTPTYNFCVVVDDWDMGITHVLRGDDHVNNTPRQINILKALGAELPQYGHVPMILGPDGQKLSKRHGAVNVMDYDAQGYLPEAMVNYLARLGWSHGDDELFSREQLVEWFDTDHLTKSASQWDPKKLNWVNAHYIKEMDSAELARRVAPRVERRGGNPAAADLAAVMGLLKDRAETLEQLADDAMLFCGEFVPAGPELAAQHLTPAAREALAAFAQAAAGADWTREGVSALIKQVLAERGIKMPQLAIPLRVAVFGRPQTPAVDAVLALLGKDKVLERLANLPA